MAEVDQGCHLREGLLGTEFEDPFGLPPGVALARHDPLRHGGEVARAACTNQLRDAQVQVDLFAGDRQILHLACVVLVEEGSGLAADGARGSLDLDVPLDGDAPLGNLDSGDVQAGKGQQVLVESFFGHAFKLRPPHDLSKNE